MYFEATSNTLQNTQITLQISNTLQIHFSSRRNHTARLSAWTRTNQVFGVTCAAIRTTDHCDQGRWAHFIAQSPGQVVLSSQWSLRRSDDQKLVNKDQQLSARYALLVGYRKAFQQQLATASNLFRWKKSDSDKCSQCGAIYRRTSIRWITVDLHQSWHDTRGGMKQKTWNKILCLNIHHIDWLITQ